MRLFYNTCAYIYKYMCVRSIRHLGCRLRFENVITPVGHLTNTQRTYAAVTQYTEIKRKTKKKPRIFIHRRGAQTLFAAGCATITRYVLNSSVSSSISDVRCRFCEKPRLERIQTFVVVTLSIRV